MERRAKAHPINLLVVDDEPGILEISKEFLELQYGMRVTTISKSSRTLELLQSEHFDAIVSDYQMPVMDGLDLLKQVRSRDIDIAFILFTGKGREEVAIEALNHGADFYVQKGGEVMSQYSDLAHKVEVAVADRERQRRLRFEKDRLRTMLDLYSMVDEPEESILQSALQATVKLCQGRKGFLAFVGASEMKAELHYTADTTGFGLMTKHWAEPPQVPQGRWSEPLIDRMAVIVNCDERTGEVPFPVGKDAVRNLVSVPIFDGDRIVMLAGVGDKFSDLDDDDVRQIGVLMNGTWEIIKRKRGETELARRVGQLKVQAQRLGESEERFRTLFRSSPNGIALLKSRFVEVNPVFAGMLGYTVEEMIGMRPGEVSPEFQVDGRASMESSMAFIQRASGELLVQFDWTHKTKDGKLVICEVTLQKVFINGEEFVLSMIHDVSAERTQRFVRNLTYEMVEAHPRTAEGDAPPDKDRTITRIVPTDDMFVSVYDQETGTISLPVKADRPEEKDRPRDARLELVRLAIQEGGPLLLRKEDISQLIAEGELDPMDALPEEWMGVPLRIGNQIVGVLAACNDHPPLRLERGHLELMASLSDQVALAVDRFRSREETMRTGSVLRSTMESIPDGVVVLDNARDRVILANRAVHEMLQMPNGSMVGMSSTEIREVLTHLISGDDIVHALEINDDLTDLAVHNFTVSGPGGRFYQVSYAPFKVGDVKRGSIWTATDVTMRREAEHYLKESETNLRQIISAAPINLAIAKERAWLEINERMVSMIGYTRPELLGKPVRFLYENDDEYERVGRDLYSPDAFKAGVSSTRSRWVRKDGSTVEVLLSLSKVDEQDAGKGHIVVATDLTELIGVQQQLKDSLKFERLMASVSRLFTQIDVSELDDAMFKALKMMGEIRGADRAYLFETSGDADTVSNTIEWCADGIESVKDGLQDLPIDRFSWWHKELKEHGAIILQDLDDLPPEAVNEKDELKGQGIKSLVVSSIFLGEELKGYIGFDYVRKRHPEADEDLELLRFIGEMFSFAMTRREKERAVNMERERLRNVLNNAPMGVIVYDLVGDDLIMVFSNDVSKRVLNRDMDDLLGRNIRTVLPGLAPGVIDGYKECLRGGVATCDDRNYVDDHAQGRFHIWTVRLSPVRLAVFFQDITETALLNERLSLANRKVSRFGKLTRHDVANKMLTARANLDLLKMKLDSPVLLKYLNSAERALTDINDIMDGLRYYLEIGAEEVEWMDLGIAMGDSMKMLGHDPAGRPRIEVDEEVGRYEVRSDKLLPIVLFNLLSNSLKHGGDVSTVRVSAEPRESDLYIVIRDDGKGVPESMQATLFDFDLKGRHGHGLNFIKEALNTSGMDIVYEGVAGEGAVFAIKVPKGLYRIKLPTPGIVTT